MPPAVARSPSRLRRLALEAALVLAGLVLVSALVRALDLDLRAARLFFRPGALPDWWAKGSAFWDGVYDLAVWPANLVGGACLAGLIASFFRQGLRRHRRSMAFAVLLLAIGPGVLVNMAGKDRWGRPRPREVVALGGGSEYLGVGALGVPGKGKSFPSGHAAMGFYFAGLAVALRSSRPRAARACLAAGVAAGGLFGLQRMAVGAHWLSDVVWAGGAVYLTALGLDAALPEDGAGTRRRRSLAGILLGSAAFVVALAAFLGTPYYDEFDLPVGPLRTGQAVRVREIGPHGDRVVGVRTAGAEGSTLLVRGVLQGYGYFDAEVRPRLEPRTVGAETLEVDVRLEPRGPFATLRSTIDLEMKEGDR